MQGVGWKWGSFFLTVELIAHFVERQALDSRSRGHMEIGILVPSIRVKEEVANAPLRLGWQGIYCKTQAQFIPTIQKNESLVTRSNQSGNITIASAPPTR